jgi:hypothetical protein
MSKSYLTTIGSTAVSFYLNGDNQMIMNIHGRESQNYHVNKLLSTHNSLPEETMEAIAKASVVLNVKSY